MTVMNLLKEVQHVISAFREALKHTVKGIPKVVVLIFVMNRRRKLREASVKLLRVLQDQQVERVGGETPDPVDVRIVAATNESLEQLYEASQEGIYLGREKLLTKAKERYLPMSQQEVRNILADMAEKGFAKVSRGRGGSRLTLQGRQLWENHS